VPARNPTPCSKVTLPPFVVAALQLYEKRKGQASISTGCVALDGLLGGGIETGAVTEVYGEFGTGKSQLCFSLSVMVQQDKSKGGLGGKVLYIDAENTFRDGERIYSIALARGIYPEQILKNITVASPSDSLALRHFIEKEAPCILEKDHHYKLLVVDSIISHHRAEYRGCGSLAARQQDLNAIMNALGRIARRHDIEVVVTNHVISSPDPYFGDSTVPAGDHVVAHASTYRIYLKKSGRNRIARR
jgi:DNA repair protein RadA